MKKNIDRIISESIRKTLSEISLATADSALEKSSDNTRQIGHVIEAISTIEDFLESYCSDNNSDMKYPNSNAAIMIQNLNDIKKFVLRKREQYFNIDSLHQDNYSMN